MSNVFEMVEREAMPASGRRKVIITCAVTGSVHTPSMSEYLPVTPVQIAEQAIEAARAGAAILHLHARNPDGSPTPILRRMTNSFPSSPPRPMRSSASRPPALRG